LNYQQKVNLAAARECSESRDFLGERRKIIVRLLARQRCAQAEAKFFHRVEPEMRLAKVASLDIRSETVT
jgi:hypothetical protein